MSDHITPERWAEIRAIATSLIGTCGIGLDAEDRLDTLTTQEHKAFDTMAGRCADCDWWCSAHELRPRGKRNHKLVCMGCQ